MKNIQYLKENGVDTDSCIELFGDIELYNGTMQDFLDSINNKLEKLEKFKKLNEIENYAIFAHSIKSDARYLGFTTVAQVALEHEMAGKNDNQKFILDNYAFLLENVEEMIRIVKEYLNEDDKTIYVEEKITKPNENVSVLVVDDALLITNLIKKTIDEKYCLTCFNKGEEAINFIQEYKDSIDVILLDLNMPKTNGYDILEYLDNNELYDTIKVSIITGDESKDAIDKAFQYPIIDMLKKPFGKDNLNNIIAKTYHS